MGKIIFLGTAGDTTVMSKQLRASGGIILQVEGVQFHLDPGPGALVKAKDYGVNVHHTTVVAVSNDALIRCNDINAVIDAMTHGGLEHRGLVLGSKSLIQGTEENHPLLTKWHRQLAEKVVSLEKNHKIGLELVEINTLSTSSDDPHAVGFKFFSPKMTVSYTGDTEISSQLVEELQGTDVLIMNVRYPGSTHVGKHLDSNAAMTIISAVKPKLAILAHFGFEMLKADPLLEAREIQRMTGVQTIAALDGLNVSLGGSGYGQYQNPVKGFV